MLSKKVYNLISKYHPIFVISIAWHLVLYFKLPNFLWDAGVSMSWFVKNGLKYYADFDPGKYLPLLRLLMIPLNKIFNWDIKLTIYLALALNLSTLLCVYKTSLRHLSKRAASVSVIFYSIWFGYILRQNTIDTNLFIGLLTLLMLSSFYKWLEDKKQKHLILFGFLSSAAFFSLQMSAIPIAIIMLLILLFSIPKKEKISGAIKRTVFPFLLGFLPIPIIMSLYFIIQDTFKEFINYTFFWYFGSIYPFLEFSFNPKDIIMLLFLSIPFFTITFFLFVKPRNLLKKLLTRDVDSWKSMSLFLVLLFIIISILFAVLHPRRYLYILPLLSFTAGLVYNKVKKLKNKKSLIATILIAFSAIYIFSSIIPWYIRAIKKGRIYEISNLSQPGGYVNNAVNWLKGNSSKDAKIHVFGPMMLYYEAQRLPANNRTYSAIPWAYEPFEETKILFTKTPADYWLVDERLFKRFQDWNYEHQSEFIRELLDTSYEKIFNSDWMSVYEYKKD